MKQIQLNTSYKVQAILGLIVGLWIVIFLIFIAPFDVSELSFSAKLELLPPYGVLVFVAYMITVLIQNQWYQKDQSWTYKKEVVLFLVLYLLILLCCFPYYKSGWVNGEFSFLEYVGYIHFPMIILTSVFIIFGRMYLNRLQAKKEINKIVLKGDNKSDILKVEPEKIVCISSTQNYVEVYYLLNNTLKKTLLRSTLKSITANTTELIQVHRSHFINPSHFVKWIDGNTILVNDITLSVSKKYKERLTGLI